MEALRAKLARGRLRSLPGVLAVVFFSGVIPLAVLRDLGPASRAILCPMASCLIAAPALWILLGRRARPGAEDRLGLSAKVLDRMLEGVVVTDAQGAIRSVNPAFLAMTGYPEGELIGQNPRLLKSGKHDAEFYQRMWTSLQANGQWQGEVINKRKDGEEYIAWLTINCIRDPEGKVVHFLGISSDITERKRAEEALRRSEERFDVALRNSPITVFTVDRDLRFLWTHDPSRSFARGEVLGRRADEVLPAGGATELLDLQRSVLRSGVGARREIRIGFPGRELHHDVTAEPLRDPSGLITGVTVAAMDITERKLAERSLQRSEERFQRLMMRAPAGIFLTDSEGRCRFVNDRWRELTGLSEEEALSAGWARALHPEDRDRVFKEWNEVGRKSEKHRLEDFRFQRPDGTISWLFVRMVALRDERGELTGHIGSLIDITERKLAEDRLREEREKLELVTRNIGAGLAIISRDYRTLWSNEGIRRICSDVVLGKKCHSCPHCGVREVLEEGKERAVHEQAGFDAAGNRTWVEVIATPIKDREGNVTAAMEVVFPITERKRIEDALRESEEKFRLGSFAAQDAIIMMDGEGRISFWNPAAERILGHPEAEILGKSLHDAIVPSRFRGAFEAAFPAWRAKGEGMAVGRVRELAALRKDGTEIAVELSISSVRHGGSWNAIGILRDITERKDLEIQLRQAQKLESIGQLAAGIAHEINTPIQYIGDNATFLQGAFRDLMGVLEAYEGGRREAAMGKADLDYLRVEVPRSIEQTLEGVARVANIVRAMKDFSHPGGEVKIPSDLNRMIESTLTVSRNEWKYVAEVETDLDPSLPPVTCLPGEINQVLLNLIVNAAQAIGDVVKETGGKGRIRVSTRRAGDRAEVRVSDTGTGIPEAIRSKVFDPFFTTKPVGKGTGQGLSIAYNVTVKRHGGAIDFQTEVGRGTEFLVSLPFDFSPAGSAPEGGSHGIP